MAFDYAYDAEDCILVITGTGMVTNSDRQNCVGRMMEDRQLPEKAAILIDVCRVENPPSNVEVSGVGSLLKQLHRRFRGPIALLNTTVGHASLSHIIAAVASESCPVRAYMIEEEARDWLKGLSED